MKLLDLKMKNKIQIIIRPLTTNETQEIQELKEK